MSKPKIAVYTAIYGNYDTLKFQPKQSVDCDFICFTDNVSIDVGEYPDYDNVANWELRINDNPGNAGLSPMLAAKFHKVLPHVCLPDYDYTLWMDGTAVINDTHCVQRMIGRIGSSNLLLFGHPFRHCIHEEAMHCHAFPKYAFQPTLDQVQYYADNGIGPNEGLWACGVLLRQGFTPKFNKLWWSEIYTRTYQDQLSFPFAARKAGLDFRTMPGNIFNNSLVTCDLKHDGSGAPRG